MIIVEKKDVGKPNKSVAELIYEAVKGNIDEIIQEDSLIKMYCCDNKSSSLQRVYEIALDRVTIDLPEYNAWEKKLINAMNFERKGTYYLVFNCTTETFPMIETIDSEVVHELLHIKKMMEEFPVTDVTFLDSASREISSEFIVESEMLRRMALSNCLAFHQQWNLTANNLKRKSEQLPEKSKIRNFLRNHAIFLAGLETDYPYKQYVSSVYENARMDSENSEREVCSPELYNTIRKAKIKLTPQVMLSMSEVKKVLEECFADKTQTHKSTIYLI